MRFAKKSSMLMFMLLMLFSATWNPVAAQGGETISGRLLSGNRGSVSNQFITLVEQGGLTAGMTFTDAAGSFAFPNVRPGSYLIHVKCEGYEEVNQPVNIHDGFVSGLQIIVTLIRKSEMAYRDAGTVDVSDFLERYPKKAVSLYHKGLSNQGKGKNDKALKNFEEAVKLAPDFYQAHNELGVAYRKAGRTDEAEEQFLRAHYLNRANSEPLVNLTGLYLDADKPDRAVTVGEEAVKTNSRSAPAFYNLGIALYRLAMLDKAEAALKKALELAPRMAQVRLMLANVYLKLRKFDNLKEQLDDYLAENPKGEQRKAVEAMRQTVLNSHNQHQMQQQGQEQQERP